MSKATYTTTYTVELTEEEAIAFAMATMSGVHADRGRVPSAIVNVGEALLQLDDTLSRKQLALWDNIGRPSYRDLQDLGAPLGRDGQLNPSGQP